MLARIKRTKQKTSTHLVLSQCRNFRVHGLERSAQNRLESHRTRVTLNGAVLKSSHHSIHITRSLCVCEGAVRRGSLQAVGVGDVALAIGCGCVAEKTEDGVGNLVGVIKVERGTDRREELLM
jgi:hypothetical protein